jgi:hypothetical protein
MLRLGDAIAIRMLLERQWQLVFIYGGRSTSKKAWNAGPMEGSWGTFGMYDVNGRQPYEKQEPYLKGKRAPPTCLIVTLNQFFCCPDVRFEEDYLEEFVYNQ